MAIQTASTIKVPMEVQMQIKNSVNEIKKVSDEMQKQFKNVDLSSAFGKQFTKLKEQITRNFADIDASLLGTELFDDADYKRVIASIGKINKAIQNLRVHGTGATAADLGLDVSAIEEANKALDELKKKKREAAKVSVGELAPSELKEFDKHKAQTGFKSTATYKQNITTLANKRGLTKVAYEALNTPEQAAERNAASDALSKAQAAYAAAQEYYTTAENNYRNAQAELSKQSQLRETARVGSVFAKIPYFTGGGRQKSDIITDYMEALKTGAEQTAGGNFTEAGASFVKMVASWLNYTDDDIAKLMKKKASTVVTQLQSALSETLNKNVFAFDDKARAATKGYNASAYNAADTLVSTTQQEFEQKKVDLETATNNQTDAQTKYDQVVKVYNETQELLELLDKQINSLRELSEQFDKDINTTYDGKIKELEQAAIDAEQAQTKEVRALLESLSLAAGSETKGAKGTEQSYFDAKALNAAQQAAEQAAREREVAEADAFKQNLQQSIKHWMSAQQIINFVKDGIRQAYQDIKGLDAAMTNIAVVTDMSVGDLWGKINDYMAIAKQYGVTTQGVYEVSQLYYQQGLGTAEVMAATTETLKMARIAGMDYAEAADAMTVAIRAFKMEMSDAQHVTDVYSKVAAVTASDAEELAIAMSKTASSAESVGSSFENTTAMLAVMIETTRESAQNLGSALKSIISRYGEMKVGLTVDSEGEEIDYNKTDTALKSVGISLKDAQGQFRDFDEVIFELSQKWDSLDKNTQRYLATIMAGNRQQSRFIALVDNWERLDEVANSAQDSEDAGLIQYAKTLDSLESKLANVKTSFQQFYMSVFNGNFFKTAVDLINNFITSLNRVGPLLGSINLLQLISQIKLIGSLLVNVFQKSLSTTSLKINNWKKSFTEGGWTTVGETIGEKIGAGLLNALKEAGVKIPDAVEEAAVANALAAEGAKNQIPTTPIPTQQQIAFTQASALQMQTGLLFNKNFGSAGQYFGNIQNIIGKGQKVQGQQNYGYKGAAQAILANKDTYDASAVQWAESVNQSGQKWSDVVKLSTTEEKAAAAEVIMKEIASADAILAKNQAGATQVGSLMNNNFNTASNYIITGAQEFANIVKGAASGVKSSDGSLWQRTKERITNSEAGQWYIGHKHQIGQGAATAGLALSSAGMMMDQSTMSGYDGSTALQAAGGALSAVGQALTGNYVGAIITGITTVSTMFTRISERAKVELENAEKAASEANIKRAEARTEENDLESTINNLKKLQEARYDSEEAMQAYIDASNTAIEKYPELANTVNATGQQMADVLANTSQAERLLTEARQASAEATYKAVVAERNKIIAEQKINSSAIDYYNYYANTTTTKRWGNQGILADLDEFIPSFRKTFAHPTNSQAFQLIADLYNPDSMFYKGLQQYAEKFDIDFSELQQSMDQQILALFGGDKKIIGESSTTAYEALQYHKSLIPQQSTLMNQEAASNQAIITSKIDELFTAQRTTQLSDSWQDVTWLKELGTTWAAGDFNYTDTMFDATGLTAYGLTQLSEHINNFANELDNFYIAHTEDLSSIEQLLQQASQGTVSYSNFQSQLADFGIDESLNIYGMFDAAWIQNDIGSRNFYANAIANQMQLKDVSFESYENWLGDKQDTFENQQKYREQLLAQITSQIAGDNKQIGRFIVEASIQQLSQYLSVLKETSAAKKLLAEGDNAKSTEIAIARGEWIQQQLLDAQAQRKGTIWEEGILKADQSQQLLETLLTDIGTYDWVENVTNLITSFGVELDQSWLHIEQYAYENYQIRLQNLIDSASGITEQIDSLLEKQEKGFTWEEAQNTLKQLQKIDSNATWANVFDVNEQGVITLENFAISANKLYQASLQDLQKQNVNLQNLLVRLEDTSDVYDKNGRLVYGLDLFNPLVKGKKQSTDIAQTYAKSIALGYNITDASQIDAIANAIAEGEIYSYNSLVAFFQKLANDTNNAVDIITKQNQNILLSDAFSEYTKTFDNATKFKSLIEATSVSDFEEIWKQQAAKQKDISNWTTEQYKIFYEEQAAAIEGAEFDAFGNLEITDAQAYTDYVATLLSITDTTSKEYQQVTANAAMQLEQQREDALNKISDLGAIAASGEDTGAYWEAFDETGLSYQQIEQVIPWAIQQAYQGNDYHLMHGIREQLRGEEFEGSPEEFEAEVTRRYDELMAGYRDGINENILEYIDLASKSAEGLELTETEALHMGKLSDLLGTQLSQELYNAVTANASDTVGKYASIINAVTQADLPWGQIEDIVRDSYTNMLDTIVARMRSGDETMSAEKWETLETISDTAGIFDNGTLAEIFTAAQKEGIAIKPSKFANAFRWDDTVNGLVVKSTAAVKALFGDAGDEYVDAILKANNEFTLQKAIDFSKYQDTLNDLFSDVTEVTLEDIQNAYDEIHGEGAFAQSGQLERYQQAIAEAKNGNTEMLIEYLRVLAAEADVMGYDVDFSELEAALEDAQISLIDRLVDFLEAGIEGTLSATEHADLKDRYNLSEGIQTAQGIQLTREDRQKMFGAIYGQARVSGNLQGIEDTLIGMLPDGTTFEDLGSAIGKAHEVAQSAQQNFENIRDNQEYFAGKVTDESKKLTAEAQATADAAWDYYNALVAAQKALMLNEDAYDFTFMEQEPTDGLTANFDNFKDQIDSVADAFKAFKSKEAIDYKDFYNMMDFINEQGQWESFTNKVKKAGLDYEQFVNSVVSNTDEWGKVDIGSVAAELGISVDAAMTAMSESMTDGLKEVANQQVKYLGGLEKMLEAMVALEGLNVEAGIDFSISYTNDTGETETFNTWQTAIDYYNKLPAEEQKTFFANLVVKAENDNANVFENLFGTNGYTEGEANLLAQIEEKWNSNEPGFRKRITDLTQEQVQWLAESFTDAEGNIDYEGMFKHLISDKKIEESWGAAFQAAFAGDNTVEIDGQSYEINLSSFDKNSFTVNLPEGIDNFETEYQQKLTDKLNKELLKQGSIVTNLTEENGKVTVQISSIDVSISEALSSGDWTITEGTGEEATQYTQDLTIDGLSATLSYTVGQDNFVLTSGEGELTEEQIRSYFMNKYGLSKDGVNIEAGEAGFAVELDFTQKEDSLAAIKTAVETIAAAVETGISFTIDNAKALAAITDIQNAIDAIPASKDLTINVKQGTIGGVVGAAASVAAGIIGALAGGEQTGDGNYTGTVNSLHGSALADGNTKLLAGANLANKTLVGELGPELAVYNGKYHMLGANGAEFVKLPDDAIVFNHLQTAGILKGQMNVRGQALASGNVSGPALAGGASAALQAVRRAKSVWEGLIRDLSAADIIGAIAGGGGGGGDNKAYIEELQEWYNLSRKIANVEQEINNLLAERENIVNGRDYLNNLRETQQFLQEQIGYQEQLLIYQDQQLDRQAEAINNHEIWSQFLVVDENGLLQYVEGNEENGGKGALEVLADLNEMSAAEQEAYLASIGYTATDSEGNALTGQALVEQFFTDIQAQIDNYDALYDTVHETEGVIEGLKSDIEDINEEITENQLGLETEIYDLIVKAWEKEIEEMEKYADLVKDANDKYIEGLQEALDKERELYERDESIKDRETLQRRLALLLRSGGSTQEIMSLEEEINDMLKDEYFANQQEAIDNIQDINEKQLEALEQEIKLEEEALAFQQENGLLWTKVNEIMNSGYEGMMNFFQANDQEFIKASALEQIEKIDEWAKRVGIYEEDKVHQGYANAAAENYWDNNKVWEDTTMAGFKSYFEAATDEERQTIKDTFLNAYANAKLEGKTDEEAFALAVQAVTTGLNALKTKYQEDDGNPPAGNPPAGQPPEGTPPATPPETQPTERYKSTYTTTYTNITSGRQRTYTGYGTGPTADIAYDNALKLLNDKKSGKTWPAGFDKQYWRISSSSGPSPAKRYATGGLVDYTGTAIVDGTPSKPEAFLDANQTAQIREALAVSGENSLLDTLKAVTSTLETTANNLTTNTNNNQSIQIAEGAVKVTVETLADSYDIEDLSNDIFNRIVAIADKSTNRSVNRR